MERVVELIARVRPVTLVISTLVLIVACQTGKGSNAGRGTSEVSRSVLERQIRTLDSIQRALHEGPVVTAVRTDTLVKGQTPRPIRPITEDLALPDSSSARNSASLSTNRSRYAAMRASSVQAVPVSQALAPAPFVFPAEVLAPFWALAPLAGATSIAQATVEGTAEPIVTPVPEPSVLLLLGSGVTLLVPVMVVRRRRTRRNASV